MKSTFSVIFYLKRQAVKKDGTVPVMGRITVDGTQTQFSTNFRSIPNCGTRKADVSREEVQPHLKQTACLTRCV